MERRELLALVVVGLILIGVPGSALAYQYWLRPASADHRVIDIRASVAGDGGFSPDAVRVAAGETVTLRFASTDVTHGVAMGPGLGIDLGPVDPGRVKEVTLTFDRPGTYTFYCTTWCSADHWRMRGTIEVIDPANPGLVVPAQPDPVIAALIAEGIDIDSMATLMPEHGAAVVSELLPSVERGAAVVARLTVPDEIQNLDWQRTHTPRQAVERLAVANPTATEADLRDAVAYLWTQNRSGADLARAQQLYNQNCAACHGQYGGGDGPAADTTAEDPVAFNDVGAMFDKRSDVLYAKIRRGGMGTDMPNFGTVFTPEETWALVEYLWSLSANPPR